MVNGENDSILETAMSLCQFIGKKKAVDELAIIE